MHCQQLHACQQKQIPECMCTYMHIHVLRVCVHVHMHMYSVTCPHHVTNNICISSLLHYTCSCTCWVSPTSEDAIPLLLPPGPGAAKGLETGNLSEGEGSLCPL